MRQITTGTILDLLIISIQLHASYRTSEKCLNNTSVLPYNSHLYSTFNLQQNSGEESMMAMPEGRWVWASGPIESNL